MNCLQRVCVCVACFFFTHCAVIQKHHVLTLKLKLIIIVKIQDLFEPHDFNALCELVCLQCALLRASVSDFVNYVLMYLVTTVL